MFVIDEDNGIAWFEKWIEVDGPDPAHSPFSSLDTLTIVARHKGWSKQDVTAIWNSFAGTAGFDDLKPAKMFRNRPYGLQRIWEAIQRLVPENAAKAALARLAKLSGKLMTSCEPALPAKAIVEDMPKKKAKPAKAKKAAVAEVEAKSGENIQELIRLMKRKNGVSIDEAMAAIGWNATHTVRGRISVLKSKGMAIESTKHETRGRVYRVA